VGGVRAVDGEVAAELRGEGVGPGRAGGRLLGVDDDCCPASYPLPVLKEGTCLMCECLISHNKFSTRANTEMYFGAHVKRVGSMRACIYVRTLATT